MNGSHDPMNVTATAAGPPEPPTAGQPAPPPAGPAVGPAQVAQPPADRKSPGLAMFLSLMPGLGQVYVGYYQRGFVHAIVIASLIAILATERTAALTPLLALFLAFFWLYNVIDAGRRATFYNHVLAGGQSFELPSDFPSPGIGGSILGGLILIVGGLILLAHTVWDVPLDWLEDWWPLAGVLFGVYLILKAVLDRSGRE